ncbi:hypothetical protein CGU00_18705 [Vibrio metoecus]|nr:hypothetical protein CGU00_18705 [Vibrio metoecus]PAR59897.1 hypothetical protein CGT90_18340 [Vibrio metoecus]
MAFPVPMSRGGYGCCVLVWLLCVASPLGGRYVLITKSQLVASFLCFLGFLILVLSANWLSVVAVFWTPIRGREKFRELPH